ncbi:frg1-like family protein [Ophiostoma piceae UAMH 11346]|uniref:Frg1-like family protein n=1 Tax=Ophiostoma piceae (strain UAMH 11346) TaxID=1262450 RepID=S3C981_OPHP1|nr:frg1-like family protein [Ophiostoma piceae UAMH 11346]
MVKPLTFKGDKKIKKRKHRSRDEEGKRQQALQAAASSALSADAVADDDTWVSAESLGDIAGPVMIVLPSTSSGTRPAALACDANGKVFAIPIENIVDGNPASAEPHDVRQVWVANRVVGTEQFRFKGHHGKFLGCDKYGLFSATSIAVSPLESFTVDITEGSPEIFHFKTFSNTYLSSQASGKDVPDVRGDAAETNLNTALRIRMQARFKPQFNAQKEEKAREKISQRELEAAVGRRLEDDEVKMLKRARRNGDYHEKILDLKVKDKTDRHA